MHAGAGAYICGEETALLDSLEGRRGQPRLKPPFPAVAGLYACPTVVNNVETIASVPAIVLGGCDWYRSMGTEKSPGPEDLLAVRARHAARLSTRPRWAPRCASCWSLAGGMLDGIPLKFCTPGRLVDPDLHRRAPGRAAVLRRRRRGRLDARHHRGDVLQRDGVGAVGGHGSGWSSTSTSPAASARRAARAPTGWCRSCAGSSRGSGTLDDLDTMVDAADNIVGRSFCALGDARRDPDPSPASSTSAASSRTW